MSNPEAIGQTVFVCEAYRGITIRTVISRANHHKGAIERLVFSISSKAVKTGQISRVPPPSKSRVYSL
jgi:hypothetical protein